METEKIRTISLATGRLAYPYIRSMAERMEENFDLKLHVYEIVNEFLGNGLQYPGF